MGRIAAPIKFLGAQGEFHVFDTKVKWDQPIRLKLLFENIPPVRISSATDGYRLRVDRQELEPAMDMGEFGSTKLLDATELLKIDSGQVIQRVRSIDDGKGTIVGLAFQKSQKEFLCVWIAGGEIGWGPQSDLEKVWFGEASSPIIGCDFYVTH
ncbi:MAG: hypothetical protein ABJP34_08200 [Erythrobacter sp.]